MNEAERYKDTIPFTCPLIYMGATIFPIFSRTEDRWDWYVQRPRVAPVVVHGSVPMLSVLDVVEKETSSREMP